MSDRAPTNLVSIVVGGTSDPWEALGFTVDEGGRIPFLNGALEFTGSDSGLLGLVVHIVDDVDDVVDLPSDVEGIALASGVSAPALDHPNGSYELDHLVIITDALERTSDAVTATLGLERRRIRETSTVRQAFHRFGPQRGCILELVENLEAQRPSLFGLVVNVADLDAMAERYGPDVISEPKDAVQPGRRIATVRKRAGLGVATALMTPEL